MRPRRAHRARTRQGGLSMCLLLAAGLGTPLLPAQHRLETFNARVVAVLDGDSFEVLRDGRRVGVRLEGIDCPERGQPFSDRAKRFTSRHIFGRTVSVEVRDLDRYGRLVSRVRVDGLDMSVELVRAGLAWHFTRYSRDPVLAAAERDARAAHAGLWSQPNPTPPWVRRPATPPARN